MQEQYNTADEKAAVGVSRFDKINLQKDKNC